MLKTRIAMLLWASSFLVQAHASEMVANAVGPVGAYAEQTVGATPHYINFDPFGGRVHAVGPLGNTFTGGGFQSGEYADEFAIDSDSGMLIRIDTATAATTPVGVTGLTGPVAGPRWSPVTGQAYLITTDCSEGSTLYLLNSVTGAATVVGVSNAECIVAIAFNRGGQLLGINAPSNTVLLIDPNTASAAAVGALGPVLGKVIAMDFDRATNIPYVATYDTVTDTSYVYAGAALSPTVVGATGSGPISAFALAGSSDSIFIDGFEPPPAVLTPSGKGDGGN